MISFVDDKSCESFSLNLFHGVENGQEIRNTVFKSKKAICLLNPQCVWDSFQLRVALTKALQNEKDGTMRTRAFGTEILYWLSPTTNITESLKTFGFAEDGKDLLVISGEKDFDFIKDTVKGELIALERLPELRNYEQIAKIYGVNELGEEYRTNSTLLVDCIVSKMMTKEFA